jgi:hypothetical protein
MTLKRLLLCGWLVGAGLTCSGDALASGKHWLCVDNCSTIPPGAQPAPPGYYLHKIMDIQDSNAEADDFVIYKNMWYRGGKELGPLGKYQLDLMARRLPTTPFPVVIATSKNDELDEARREVIVALLAMRGFTDPTRVIVAFPVAEGLYAEDAARVANALFRTGQPVAGTIPGVSGVPGYNPGIPPVFGGTFGGTLGTGAVGGIPR